MTYPVLFLRIKAMFLDSTINSLIFISMVLISIGLGIEESSIKIATIILPVILFEPTMIWLTGGSLGHHYSGIRIVGKNTGKNLFIINGILRFLLKSSLGLISLVSMILTNKHQAIHDILANSVVVFKNEDEALDRHKLKPRKIVYYDQKPSIIKRIMVILAYCFVTFFMWSLVLGFSVSKSCIEKGICSDSEHILLEKFTLLLLVIFLVIVILGLLSKLPGAYYKKIND